MFRKKFPMVAGTLLLVLQIPVYAQTRNLSQRSQELTRDRIEKETARAKEDPRNQPIAEATAAVKDTRAAIQFIDQNKAQEAKANLADATGKLDVLLSSHPNMTLIPFAANIRIHDTNADETTIKKTTADIRDLVKKGEYQAARPLLQSLQSEVDVATINIPVASFPPAIRNASSLLNQGKLKEAKLQLASALQAIVVIEKSIPLPVIRAQAMVDEVSRQASEKKIAKAEANQLLKDADQQMNLAESLGYGNKKDFADLRSNINSVRMAVNTDKEPKSMIARVESDLQILREKITKSLSA